MAVTSDNFVMNAFSFDIAYAKAIGNQLHKVLNDLKRLEIVYQGLINHISLKHGGLSLTFLMNKHNHHSFTIRTLQILVQYNI